MSDRDAKLFFAQARKVEREEVVEEMKAKAAAEAEAAQAKAAAEAEAAQAIERESGESRSPTLVPAPKKSR